VRTNYGLDSSLPIDGSVGALRLQMIKTFPGWWPLGGKGKTAKGSAAPVAAESVGARD
jgi:hypothetical protein